MEQIQPPHSIREPVGIAAEVNLLRTALFRDLLKQPNPASLAEKFSDEIAEYHERIMSNPAYASFFPDLPARHALIGSSVSSTMKTSDNVDLPGEDSVVLFLQNLRTRLLNQPDAL